MPIAKPDVASPERALQSSRQYGSVECRDAEQLLPQHRKILSRIIRSIHGIGRDEACYEEHLRRQEGAPRRPGSLARVATNRDAHADGPGSGRNCPAYAGSIEAREPIFAYLIDGPRGSGKTTLLRTLRFFLDQASSVDVRGESNVALQLKALAPPVVLSPISVIGTPRSLLHALPLLRPDHMETTEAIMEAVFSRMSSQLRAVIDAHPESHGRAKSAQQLIDKLNGEVAKGWYFSRSLGVEALLNDSLNFPDYIERRAREAVSSHERATIWRAFVVEYLEFFDSQLLGLFVDDTDVLPHHTVDLLHSIRMFCCHPRIVCVVAGNLHSMRQRLLMDSLTKLSNTNQALRGPASYTASFWRHFERESVEEYLEKVFPRPNRHFITMKGSDIQAILGAPTFSQYCSSQMASRLKTFVQFRGRTRRLAPNDVRKPGVEDKHERQVENYLALWLLKNHYSDRLSPRSARHTAQFQNMIEEGNRRVVVAAFTEPQNHPILQRQGDRDANAIDWLNNQNVHSRWRGARQVLINDLLLNQDMPAYDYLLFRLDLEIAKPEYAQQNAQFPRGLLPAPAGNNVWAPEVWETGDRTRQREKIKRADLQLAGDVLRLRQERYGVGRSLSSPVVPANCVYFKDLRGIPDIAWSPDESEPEAAVAWRAFPIGDVDRLFRLDRYDARNAYFQHVVLVLGTFPLLAPIPSDEFTSQRFHLLEYELCTLPKGTFQPTPRDPGWGPRHIDCEASREWMDLAPAAQGRPFFSAMRSALADRYKAAVAILGVGKISSSGELPRFFRAKDIAKELMKVVDGPPGDPQATMRYELATRLFISHIIPRYHRIVCDVRRANLALRVLEQDLIDYAQQAPGDQSPHFPFTLSQNDRYRLVGLAKLRAVLGLDLISHERGSDKRASGLGPDERYFSSKPAGEGKHQAMAPPWFDMLRVTEQDTLELSWLDKAGNKKRHHFDLRKPSSHFLSELETVFGGEAGEFDAMLRQFLDTTKEAASENDKASRLRSLLLFFWGIGPCLSSLIHLEFMGEWYSWHYDGDRSSAGGAEKDDRPGIEGSEQCRKALEDLASVWRVTLAYAACVVSLFLSALESNIERQLDPAFDGSHFFSPFPDFAISTLGLRLYKQGEARSGAFDGVAGDTILRLQLALGYLDEMELWIGSLKSATVEEGAGNGSGTAE